MNLLIKNLKYVFILSFVALFWACNDDDPAPVPAVNANFTYVANMGAVTFTNTSTNADSYSWDFGDGNSSTQENPTHNYAASGNYTVKLTATNAAGGSDSESKSIQIDIAVADTTPPVITLVGDATMALNVDDTFTDPGATASDDMDGDISANIVVGGDTVDTSMEGSYTITYNVTDAAGNAAAEVTRTVTVSVPFDSGLLTNGDFQTGDISPWIGNAANIQEDGGNYYNFAEVATAGNPWDVNLSQVVALEMGKRYKLSFQASTGAGASRTIITGIGLNEDPWTNVTETVTLSETPTDFEYEFTANFGSDNSRVIFDMGADVGVVVIDNVSLFEVDGGTDPFDGGLVTNGDFQTGEITPWIGNAANIQEDGGNFYNFAEVATAGNPWDVNLSQVIPMENGKKYKLSFQASTGAGNSRTIIAGIGLNEDPWTNLTETVTLSETPTDFEYEFTANFGSDNSRVIFDMGADVGVVVIDNVSLFEVDGGGGSSWTTADTVDFESGGHGATWTWNVFENDSNPAVEFVANPDATGANTSSTVAKITALQAGQPWAGTEIAHGQIGPFEIDASTQVIKMMVYKSVISDVGVKLVNTTNGANTEIKVANTVTDQWEELSFDFSGYVSDPGGITTDLDQIVVFPDFNLDGRTADNVVYFDNITFNAN